MTPSLVAPSPDKPILDAIKDHSFLTKIELTIQTTCFGFVRILIHLPRQLLGPEVGDGLHRHILHGTTICLIDRMSISLLQRDYRREIQAKHVAVLLEGFPKGIRHLYLFDDTYFQPVSDSYSPRVETLILRTVLSTATANTHEVLWVCPSTTFWTDDRLRHGLDGH